MSAILSRAKRNQYERHRQRVLLIEAKNAINDMIDHLNESAHVPTYRNAGISESLVGRIRAASRAFRSTP